MATIIKQVRMVFDLNKCIGCQTCTSACKTMWTNKNSGLEYMYWNNVETKPGRGYPKNWETIGGGWNGPDLNINSPIPEIKDGYGSPWEYNYDKVQMTDGGDATASTLTPSPDPVGKDAYSSNWDEDVATGTFPDSYYFYLPRICNHCTNPACVAACPRQVHYKREEDGIVLSDQERCRGYRFCVKACPYKKPMYNALEQKTQKCIFCYPRVEKGQGNFCVAQCVGRIRWVGYHDPNIPAMDPVNLAYNVNRLVDEFGVALRLHPEFGTEPNTFYIPPFSPPGSSGNQRIPIDYLADLFGDNAIQTHAERVTRIQGIFDLITAEREIVRLGGTSALIDTLIQMKQADRIQLVYPPPPIALLKMSKKIIEPKGSKRVR